MNALVLILAALQPPQAPPVLLEQAPPVLSARSPSCDCGDTCPCVAGGGVCECGELKKAADNFTSAKSSETDKRFYFWASWCGPCKQTAFAKKLAGVTSLDFDTHQALAASFGVDALPAFVVVKDGKHRRVQGARSESSARDFYGLSVVTPPAVGPPVGVAQQSATPAGFHYAGGKLVDADGAVVTEIDGKPVAQAAAPVRQARTAGWHTHTCRCGNSWSHGREANGNRAMHTCGVCGREEWN